MLIEASPSLDPQPLLRQAREIIATANREARDLTPLECDHCDRLLNAAEALARLPAPGRRYSDVTGCARVQ